MSEMIERVARAMEQRRQELIAKPLNRIWPELARAALDEIERVEQEGQELTGIERQRYLASIADAMTQKAQQSQAAILGGVPLLGLAALSQPDKAATEPAS